MSARYSTLALAGMLLGGVGALPIYTRLPDALQIPPNMIFLTLATCFAGWAFGALTHSFISGLLRGKQ
ncbi:MAG: hypothetical protein RR704_00910 [Stenotrophomonas sp.]